MHVHYGARQARKMRREITRWYGWAEWKTAEAEIKEDENEGAHFPLIIRRSTENSLHHSSEHADVYGRGRDCSPDWSWGVDTQFSEREREKVTETGPERKDNQKEDGQTFKVMSLYSEQITSGPDNIH